MSNQDTIWVVTGEPTTRGLGPKELKLEDLAVSVNLFLTQMNVVLDRAPQKLGKFHFVEFEVHAEVTAKGTLAILGSGGEAGASGGLKFIFRRQTMEEP